MLELQFQQEMNAKTAELALHAQVGRNNRLMGTGGGLPTGDLL